MINLKDLMFPLLILDKKRGIAQLWVDFTNLKSLQKSIILKNELVGSKLFSFDGGYFEIMVLEDKGRLTPFWKYGLFNPLHKVEIFVNKVESNFDKSKNDILEVVSSDDSFWNEYPFHKSLINEIKNSKNLTQIINAFIAIEG